MQNLLFLGIPVFLGILVVFLLWKDETTTMWGIQLILGIGVGIGINALLFFIYLHIMPSQKGYLVLQLLLIFILIPLLLVPYRRKRKTHHYFWKKLSSFSWMDFLWLIITISIVALALTIFVILAKRNLYGGWDAWAMYNRTARFIFRAGTDWRSAFSPQLLVFHPDYPPLIALNIASVWSIIEREDILIPVATGGLFFIGSAGLLFSGIMATKTRGQAVLALGSLLIVTDFIRMGTAQMADIPLSFFMLATALLFYLKGTKKRKKLLVLAGLTSGLAAWTKNEGILFMLTTSLALLIVYYKDMSNNLPWYLLGLFLPTILLIFFKLSLAPANDLFIDPSQQWKQIIDIKRHRAILESFAQSFLGWGNWVPLILYSIIMKIKIEKDQIPALKVIMITLFLQIVGYYMIFLLTPRELAWHLSTATPRLLLQLAPLFFFLYFSLVRSPENVLILRNEKASEKNINKINATL